MILQSCSHIRKLRGSQALLPLLCALALAPVEPAFGADPASASAGGAAEGSERNFYQVLEDVLADFEYDLKNGNVNGLKDIAIRNVAMSENVPPSFRSHLELLITERILKTTKTRVIQCLPCRARKTALNGDQVVVTSADNNPTELSRIAKASSIENFLDLAFSYQARGIVLSMTIASPDSGSIVWSRSYNSEMTRASAFRRGVDYTQTDEARKQTEYSPSIQYRGIAYYLFEPNVGGTTGTLGAGFRMMERYDNRKKEVGFELNFLKDSSTLVGSTAASATTVNLYGGFNLTLLFQHGWNFFGEEENYNKVRGGLVVGLGGTYASGFLGGLVRAQYEWRLGKHYAVSATAGYRPSSTAFLATTSVGSVSGLEFGIGINMLF
ncbi:MAG: hypothetical protein NDJ89_02095 [Oligoflexia bacterium]|nr:hypothetical protein [Oligoflexia bacterium]